MALALQSVVRSQDAALPGASLMKVSEITPKNWHKFPPAIQPSEPSYNPDFTVAGGAPNTAPYTPVEHGTAAVIVDERGVGDYTPRTQSDKAVLLGLAFADPINTPFGSIEPRDPYPTAGYVAPVAPTITALTPDTAVVGEPALMVKVTGTGFTQYSVIEVGGTNYAHTTYVSPTELRFPVDTKNSVAGIIDVKVLDHNLKSDAASFTFT
jgi:IPT/TIG domain-containing protein